MGKVLEPAPINLQVFKFKMDIDEFLDKEVQDEKKEDDEKEVPTQEIKEDFSEPSNEEKAEDEVIEETTFYDSGNYISYKFCRGRKTYFKTGHKHRP